VCLGTFVLQAADTYCERRQSIHSRSTNNSRSLFSDALRPIPSPVALLRVGNIHYSVSYTIHSITFAQSVFSYLIADNVVFLTIAEKSYPRKLAFSYLDELSKEFATSYGPKVESVRKPYAFVGFGIYLLERLATFSDFPFVQTPLCQKPLDCIRTRALLTQQVALAWTNSMMTSKT
jgi:hypothetical protein